MQNLKRKALILSLIFGFISGNVMSVHAVETLPADETESYMGYVDIPHETYSVHEGMGILRAAEDGLPEYYDSREQGWVTSVKDQSPWGTCWSFSAMAALESSLISNGTYSDIDLSEYHLINYTFFGVEDPLGGTAEDSVKYNGTIRQGMESGGNVLVGFHALTNWMGAVDESRAVYPDGGEEPTPLASTVGEAYLNDVVHLQQMYKISKQDVGDIKKAIMEYGGVTGAMAYYASFMQGSTGGYYNDRDRDTGSNHAITVVGWDDNYSRDNFRTTPDGDGAWLVKNSWGTGFGRDGYLWVSYEDTSLQDTFCVLLGESADNYDHNYQYDGSYWSAYLVPRNYAAVSNVFRIPEGENKEALGAVSFEMDSPNVAYSIQIYKRLSDEKDPTSGQALLTEPLSGSTNYQGYYTVKLPEEILLEPGDDFSVVITFTKDSSIRVVLENSRTWNNTEFVAGARENQSFLQTEENGEWTDVGSKYGVNLRIKAFTKDTDQLRDINVTGVTTPQELALTVGEESELEAVVYPANATNKQVTWESADSAVATVDANGKVTGVGKGTTVITCTTEDGGYTSRTSVTVSDNIAIVADTQELYVGDSVQLLLNINGQVQEVERNRDYEWRLEGSDQVVEISGDGEMIGILPGTATVYCVNKEDPGETATLEVTVRNHIVIVADTRELLVGESVQLLLNINGNLQDADYNEAYIWYTVEDGGAITISQDGRAGGVAVGKTTVRCVGKAREEDVAECVLQVRIPFTDIKRTDWQYPYVVYAYEKGIMTGKSSEIFDMNGKLTRAEFVTVLYSYSGKPTATYTQDFWDVEEQMWYALPITWAKQEGVTAGFADGSFGVSKNITREQLMTMLYGYAKKDVPGTLEKKESLSGFADEAAVSSWAAEAMEWAVANQLITGKPGNGEMYLDPLGNTTRGECATIMKKYGEILK